METFDKTLKNLVANANLGCVSVKDFADSLIVINDTAWKNGVGKQMWDLFHEHYATGQKKTIVETKILYNTIAKVYEKEKGRKKLLQVEEKAILGFLPKKGKVLDAGCGTGRYSILLAKRGCEVVGIDFSEEMLKQAKKTAKHKRITYKLADIRKIPYPKDLFDHTICTLVLNHLSEWKKAAGEIARVTKPGGSIVISIIHPEMFESGTSLVLPFSKTRKGEVWTEEWKIPISELMETAKCNLVGLKEVSDPHLAGRMGLKTSKSPFLMIVKFMK